MRYALAACLAILLTGCAATAGTPSGNHAATSAGSTASPSSSGPSPSASTSALPIPPTVELLPSFPTAQLASIYGVQEGILADRMTHANSTPAIYTPGTCTPTASLGCLTGGAMTMGTYAGYGEFANSGTGGGSRCYAYVFEDAAGWHSFESACTQNVDIVPLVGQPDTVKVSSCGNVRQDPYLQAHILACLPEGTMVDIDGGPQYSDSGVIGQLGTLWWHLKGRGWMAHQNLVAETGLACTEPRCALQNPSCPAGFQSGVTLTGMGPFTSTHLYDSFPLPPQSSEQGNSGAGFLGANLCTGGTIEEITAFVDTELESRGFHYTGASGCTGGGSLITQCWAAGPSNRYDFTYGLSSPAGWMLGFHNPDNFG